MRTSYEEKEQQMGTQKMTVTFEEPDQEWIEDESKKSGASEFVRGRKKTLPSFHHITAQRNDLMTSNLKRWIENCAQDKLG